MVDEPFGVRRTESCVVAPTSLIAQTALAVTLKYTLLAPAEYGNIRKRYDMRSHWVSFSFVHKSHNLQIGKHIAHLPRK